MIVLRWRCYTRAPTHSLKHTHIQTHIQQLIYCTWFHRKEQFLYTTDNSKYGSCALCGFCFQVTGAVDPELHRGNHMAWYKVTMVNERGVSVGSAVIRLWGDAWPRLCPCHCLLPSPRLLLCAAPDCEACPLSSCWKCFSFLPLLMPSLCLCLLLWRLRVL